MSILASLPLHPLLVHIPVVLVPLLFVAAIAIAVRRSWFDKLAIATGLVAIVAGFGTALAGQSGEELEEKVKRTAAVHDHVELGDQAKFVIIVFLFALLAWIALDWLVKHRPSIKVPQAGAVLKGLMALSIVLGAVSTVWVFRAGHSGATATWNDKTGAQVTDGGDDGD